MRKFLAILVAALLLAVGGVYFGSPYWAARALRQAAARGDTEALAEEVDFPQVRAGLKAQVSARIAQRLGGDGVVTHDPLAALGMLVMPVIIDRAIDGLVTPQALAALLQGHDPAAPEEDQQAEPAQVRFGCAWLTADRFEVKVTGGSAQVRGLAFVLERRGFASWKLVWVGLPAALLGPRENAVGPRGAP